MKIKRKTSQRRAIEQVFYQLEKPLSVEDVLIKGREIVESLNQATVYRNLKLMVERGWLKQINHPSLGTLWERAEKGHHHHFYCHVCNNVYDLPGCTLNQKEAVPAGFIMEDHEVYISGTCPSCSG